MTEVMFLIKTEREKIVLFYLSEIGMITFCGGCIYYSVEMLWRGRSHFSMALVGGICFLLLYLLGKALPRLPALPYCILGGIIITSVELCSGELLNNLLGLGIWDYSDIPLNFRGQICLLFSFFWCLLSLPAFHLVKLVRKKIFGYQS